MYYDTQNFVSQDNIICCAIPLYEVHKEREEGLRNKNPYWLQLGWEKCHHEKYGDSITVRRVYIGHPSKPITIECNMAIVLLTQFFIINATFSLFEDTPSDFQFAIDTTTGEWIKNSESE